MMSPGSADAEEGILYHSEVNIYSLDPKTHQYRFRGRGDVVVLWNEPVHAYQVCSRHGDEPPELATVHASGIIRDDVSGPAGISFSVHSRSEPSGQGDEQKEWHYYHYMSDKGAGISLQFDDHPTGFNFATHVALASWETLGRTGEVLTLDLKTGAREEEPLGGGHWAKVGYAAWNVLRPSPPHERVLRCSGGELENVFQKPVVVHVGDTDQFAAVHTALDVGLRGMRKHGWRVVVAPAKLFSAAVAQRAQASGVIALWIEVNKTKPAGDPPRSWVKDRRNTTTTEAAVAPPAPTMLQSDTVPACSAALRERIATMSSVNDGGAAEDEEDRERRERARKKLQRLSMQQSSSCGTGARSLTPHLQAAAEPDVVASFSSVPSVPPEQPPSCSAPPASPPLSPDASAQHPPETANQERSPEDGSIKDTPPPAPPLSVVVNAEPQTPLEGPTPASRAACGELSYSPRAATSPPEDGRLSLVPASQSAAAPVGPTTGLSETPTAAVSPTRRCSATLREQSKREKRRTRGGTLPPSPAAVDAQAWTHRSRLSDDGRQGERDTLISPGAAPAGEPSNTREWELCAGNGAFPVASDAVDPEIPAALRRAAPFSAAVMWLLSHPATAALRIACAVGAAALAVVLLADSSGNVRRGSPEGPVALLAAAVVAAAVDAAALLRRRRALRAAAAACAHRCAVMGVGDGLPDARDLLSAPVSLAVATVGALVFIAAAAGGGVVSALRSGDGARFAIARLLVWVALAGAIESAVLLFAATGSLHMRLLAEAVPALARNKQGRLTHAADCRGQSWVQSLVVRWAAARQLVKEAAAVWCAVLAAVALAGCAVFGWALWWVINVHGPKHSSAAAPLAVCLGVSIRLCHFATLFLGWREANARALDMLLQHFEWRQGIEAQETRMGRAAGALENWHACLAYFGAATAHAPAVWRVGPGEPPRWLVRSCVGLLAVAAAVSAALLAVAAAS
eukprot:TRINITY_DN22712_c0_g1_i1.p1 TRINITY_DN22712_c0_g1~~TRINITY_DN22712_c0_g1_i1.p1  ORF type:complete len:1002 (+),score=191.34 TRINITY_DN22712_c0_g1_i1:99-3008(+)